MAIAADDIFERGKLLNANRSAGMHFTCGNTDLGTHAKLTTIGELGRGVMDSDGAIDAIEENLSCRRIIGDDGVGMFGAMPIDVIHRILDAIDLAYRNNGIEIFGIPIFFRSRYDPHIKLAGFIIAANFTARCIRASNIGGR